MRTEHTVIVLFAFGAFAGQVPSTSGDDLHMGQELSMTAGGHSSGLQLSTDSSVVAFLSDAPDLVAGVPSGRVNLFHKDLQTGLVDWMNIDAPGRIESYSMSGDGERFAVCFRRDLRADASSPASLDVYLWSEADGLLRISESSDESDVPDGDCWDPWITPDGRFVFFKTRANNILPGHFFNDYGFGVVRYRVEDDVMDAGIPVFGQPVMRLHSPVLYSPDGNLVFTLQRLPGNWEGESPFEDQETSDLINVFKIDEARVIIPPSSPDLPFDELQGDPSTAMRLDSGGSWVSVSSWNWAGDGPHPFVYEAFSFNVATGEAVVAPQERGILTGEGFAFGAAIPIRGGDFFAWPSVSAFGLWNRELGVVPNPPGGDEPPSHIWQGSVAVASSDNRLIASARSPRGYENFQADRMMVWDLDSNEVTEFGPEPRGFDEELEIYHDDGFGQPNFVFSADSQFLFFETAHPGFVENDNNRATDLFRYSIETGEILLISARNPDLPLPNDGFTVSAPVVENAVTRIFHKHRIDADAAWIEAGTTAIGHGRVKFKDVGSTIHQHKFYKSEVTPVEGGQ